MGREKRAAQSRAQELLEKTGRGSDTLAGAPAAATVSTVPHDKPQTSTQKAILQILVLYLGPVLLIYIVGKLFLKL